MKNIIKVLVILSILALPVVAQDDFDINRFYNWFEGEFDSFAQVQMDKELKLENPHARQHSIFQKSKFRL